MDTRSILLAVAEPQALVDITQALGAAWEATSVATEADALAQVQQRSFDALLVDFNLGSPDASELLNQALEKSPETIQFLLAYEADLALVAAKVLSSPHILPKPIEPASLKSRLESALNQSKPQDGGSEPTAGPGEPPAVPAIYAEVLKLIESPGVTAEQVGAMLAQDAELTAEVLKLTQSDYLGLPRNLTDPVEAVGVLGLEPVKALVRALQFLAERSGLRPGYLSLDQIWQHSLSVGRIARDLMLFETKDRALASQALAAGLLHDLGKVVLVTNFDDLYGRVHSLARKQPVPLWEIEKEMFGANHGEIGACLMGMWNMPNAIVEAAAFHHEPVVDEQQQQLTPLAAVHIANVLEHELRLNEDGLMVAPIMNTPFLNGLGLLQRLPVWRAAFSNRRAANFAPDLAAADTELSALAALSSAPAARTGNYLPGPAGATRTATTGQPRSGEQTPALQAASYRRRWLYLSAAAAILVLLAVSMRKQPELNAPERVYARTRPAYPVPAATSSQRSTEPATAAAPPVSLTAADLEQPPVPLAPAAKVPEPTASVAAPGPAQGAAPKAVVTKAAPLNAEAITLATPTAAAPKVAAPTGVAPKPKAASEFRLNGIIYSSVRPSAMINGQTVSVGDPVGEATVLAIGPTSVTLQINGQRKTYELR